MAKFKRGNCKASIRYTSITVENEETGEDEIKSVPLWDFSNPDCKGCIEVEDQEVIALLIREGAELIEEEESEEEGE